MLVRRPLPLTGAVFLLHIELTPARYQRLVAQAKRGLCLMDQIYELMYQIAKK